MGWLSYWFGAGVGAGVAKTLLGEDRPQGSDTGRWPIRQQTEEEIRADEKRYAEDEKRLDAADAAAKRHSHP
jgi:hypothetical protein